MGRCKNPEILVFVILFASLSILMLPIFIAPGSPISVCFFLDLLILTIAFDLSELFSAALVHCQLNFW